MKDKGRIKSQAGAGLYVFLMWRNGNPHRFLTVGWLIGSSLRNGPERGAKMLDFLLLALAAGLFVLTIGYAYACDRL